MSFKVRGSLYISSSNRKLLNQSTGSNFKLDGTKHEMKALEEKWKQGWNKSYFGHLIKASDKIILQGYIKQISSNNSHILALWQDWFVLAPFKKPKACSNISIEPKAPQSLNSLMRKTTPKFLGQKSTWSHHVWPTCIYVQLNLMLPRTYLIVTNLLVPCLAQWVFRSIGLEKL